MSGKSPAPWSPEPGPQNALERRWSTFVQDPALHGQMFRRLWAAELTILIPDHPEIRDGFELGEGDSLTFVKYEDAGGSFVPVFTSEAAAEYAVQRLCSKPYPAMATAPAEAILPVLNDGDTRVIINAGLSLSLVLKPQALADLVAGQLTHARAGNMESRRTSVRPVDADSLPPELHRRILAFCDQHPVPVGVYAFCPWDPDTQTADTTVLRLILWLRSTDNDFYNDFALMAGRLMPPHLKLEIGVMTAEDTENLAYLHTCTPLWPVLPAAT